MISTDLVKTWLEACVEETRRFHERYPFSLLVNGWPIFVDQGQTSLLRRPEEKPRVVLIPEALEFIHQHGGSFHCEEIDEVFERPCYVGFESETSAVVFKLFFHK